MFGRRRRAAADAEYEYVTVAIGKGYLYPPRKAEKEANKEFARRQKAGWEFVSQSSGSGAKITLIFRRIR